MDKKKQIVNKKAKFDYELSDFIEAGIVLTGNEIKAIRNGRINLTGSHVRIMNGEAFWLGGILNTVVGDHQRTRKLLLHKAQLQSLAGKTQEKGLTIVPVKLYLKKGRAKIELGIGKGMKKYDKREVLKKKDRDREAMREVKQF